MLWTRISNYFFGREDYYGEDREAGGMDMTTGMDLTVTQGETVYEGAEVTQDDLTLAARDVQFRRTRRFKKKNANRVRLNLRKKISLGGVKNAGVIGKAVNPTEQIGQEAADVLFAQTVAEAVLDFNFDDLQSRPCIVYLGFMDYLRAWRKNRRVYEKIRANALLCDFLHSVFYMNK